MPTDEWLARPLKEFIRTVAFSVAEGQEELDRRSMEVQRAIDRDIEDGSLAYDLDASWLRFADVEADLEMTLSIEGQEIRDPETNEVRAYKPVRERRPAESPRRERVRYRRRDRQRSATPHRSRPTGVSQPMSDRYAFDADTTRYAETFQLEEIPRSTLASSRRSSGRRSNG